MEMTIYMEYLPKYKSNDSPNISSLWCYFNL
jgi:hypothetical protein